MKYDVFISYSSHDQKVVEGLCAYLEQHKIRCFVAYRDIPRGVVWARAIVDALDESRMMVVVFSENFNNSDQVDREIELASEDKKPILTFRISNDVFKGAKKYYLKNINWIDAFPNPEQVFGSVAENVSSLLGIQLSHVAQSSLQTTSKQDGGSTQSAKRYKVGEYYDDGVKQGVVFDVWDDGRHGKIVSLDQIKLKWCTMKQSNKIDFFGALSTTDGKANSDKVMSVSDYNGTPAVQWCRIKGEEWYLPAIDELKALLLEDNLREIVNKTLEQHKKKMFTEDVYLSSTEVGDGFLDAGSVKSVSVDPRIGMGVGTILKWDNFYVRAVATF